MAFSTEFIMGAGGAEVEEIPVSASGLSFNESVTLTTITPPAGRRMLVSVVCNVTNGDYTSLWIGTATGTTVTGTTGMAAVVSEPSEVRFARGLSFSGTSSLTGTMYTVLLPD